LARDDLDGALPLTVGSFHILLALASGERHGYVIAQDVERETEGAVVLGTATLYRTIKQLLADGWISETSREQSDARRRAYRLTSRGRKVAEAEATRLDKLVRIARERRLLPLRA
jgi:DNA-binding PadR family transcriptional regulator